MLKFFFSGLLLFAVSLFAGQGAVQEHLVKVSPSVSATEVSPKVQILIMFDREIAEYKLKKNTFVVSNNNKRVEGEATLSTDRQSIVFTPYSSLLAGLHSVKLLPLKLEGSEKQPCNSIWNYSKLFMHKQFGWFDQHICYEDVPLVSKRIKYSFSVAENAIKVTSLNITTKTTDLNESETVPVTVTAFFDDNTTEDVTDKVSWESSDSSVAKVEDNMIVAQSEGSAQLTAAYNSAVAETLNINVYKVVDNHRLPPEPDEALNNVTLLGIDVNNNGVRDDVERWIYLEMEILNGYPKIERAIGMQTAKANQMALSDPSNKDDKVQKMMTASLDCWTWYGYSKKLPFQDGMGTFFSMLQDKVFNTRMRLKTYYQYDFTLAGRVFTSTATLQTKSQCETNIDEL
ncbi:Ig-like domain-containing protein [Sulfurimonas sp. HSL3-7]|uniref:Ig-like domain-containing protein n=1 Tax=Sulfonitrofixus jiaomeiensis TaxID=3131938 RepID=UPI0031F9245E